MGWVVNKSFQSEVIEQKEDMINCLQEELIKVSCNVSRQSNHVIYWVVFWQNRKTGVEVTKIILTKISRLWISFPQLRVGWIELFYLFLPLFIFKSLFLLIFFKSSLIKFFIVLWNKWKTNKNPDESSDLTLRKKTIGYT